MKCIDADALLERLVYADAQSVLVDALHDFVSVAPTILCRTCAHLAVAGGGDGSHWYVCGRKGCPAWQQAVDADRFGCVCWEGGTDGD